MVGELHSLGLPAVGMLDVGTAAFRNLSAAGVQIAVVGFGARKKAVVDVHKFAVRVVGILLASEAVACTERVAAADSLDFGILYGKDTV